MADVNDTIMFRFYMASYTLYILCGRCVGIMFRLKRKYVGDVLDIGWK
jgi:hypothetical protein